MIKETEMKGTHFQMLQKKDEKLKNWRCYEITGPNYTTQYLKALVHKALQQAHDKLLRYVYLYIHTHTEYTVSISVSS